MDLRNLKIGNYIHSDGKIVEVVAIESTKDKMIELKVSGGERVKGKANQLKIAPIKLSLQLLCTCCGFDESGMYELGIDKNLSYLKLQMDHIVLLTEAKEPLIHFWEVQFLHQLQNLYYTLTGKEMAISL